MTTATSYTKTGATGEGSIVRGAVVFLSGDWDSGSYTKMGIVTGAGKILACGVSNSDSVTAPLKVKWNADEDGGALDGSIGITACTAGDGGQWWAICKLA